MGACIPSRVFSERYLSRTHRLRRASYCFHRCPKLRYYKRGLYRQLYTAILARCESKSIEAIPPSIATLKKLTHLNFSRNMLTSLPLEITALRNADLDISFNGLNLLDWSLSHLMMTAESRLYQSKLMIKLGSLERIRRIITTLRNLTNAFRSGAQACASFHIEAISSQLTGCQRRPSWKILCPSCACSIYLLTS